MHHVKSNGRTLISGSEINNGNMTGGGYNIAVFWAMHDKDLLNMPLRSCYAYRFSLNKKGCIKQR